MKLRPEEITSILKQRIEQYDVETDLSEVGTVLQVGDGIARVYGLENCVAGEMLDLGADVVLLEVERDPDDAVLELEPFEGDAVLQPVDAGDAVADLEHGADLGEVGLDVVLLDPLLEDGRDLFGA